MSATAIVVGAGIVGAAVADALAADGLRVHVVDADFPGGGTTAAGMGHIVAMDDSPAQLALTTLSQRLLDNIADELPAACELDRNGTLWIAEDDEQLETARSKVDGLARAGIRSALLDENELRQAEPCVRRGMAGAVHVPGDSVVYPPALCRFLLDRAVARGATLSAGTRVSRIERGAVHTDRGAFRADIIVNAAGVSAPALTSGLDIVPRKGHLVITDRYPGFCRHQLVELGYMRSAHEMTGRSVAFNLQPRRTGQLLIGSSRELGALDATVDRSTTAAMLRRACEFVPGLRTLSALRTWTGVRPATADKLPLIGRWPAVPGLWIAAGHEGLGITTALGTARILADLIAGRTPPIDTAAFAPDRALVTS